MAMGLPKLPMKGPIGLGRRPGMGLKLGTGPGLRTAPRPGVARAALVAGMKG